jgi:hypothetical protein
MTDYPNWFAVTAQGNFEQFLTPLAGQENLKFLQLGVFTGDASVWLAENILTGKGCWLIDVDTWQGSDEPDHEPMNFDDVYSTYLAKIEPYKDKVCHFKSTTTWHLSSVRREPSYDFIYIDALDRFFVFAESFLEKRKIHLFDFAHHAFNSCGAIGFCRI